MKKLILITASVFAMSCSSNAHETGSDATHQVSMGKIYASGTGHAAQAPDQASVSAGVVTEGETAGEAMRKNADLMTSTFAALKKAGIAERNIQTSQMSLQPRYDYQNGQNPRITGYEVRNTVSAKSEDLKKVGPMLDALVDAGVNNINGVTFTIKDSESAKDKARVAAIETAKVKAQGMAKAAGVRLGKILEIRESGGNYQPPQPMMMSARIESDASTPIAAGEQTLSVTVDLTYAIDQ